MINGITGFGPAIDYMVMQSSQDADNIIEKIDELAASGYTFTFDEILSHFSIKASDFMPDDARRIRRRVEEIGQMDRRY